jgi:hypothetical protein
MVMETTDSCRRALTTLSTTLVFPDAVPPATPMKKGSCLVLGICMPATACKHTTAIVNAVVQAIKVCRVVLAYVCGTFVSGPDAKTILGSAVSPRSGPPNHLEKVKHAPLYQTTLPRHQ